jgi:integrase
MAKRGQNEGSIYKRADGRWVGVVSLGYKHGNRCRKSFYGNTRREVQERLTEALRAHQQNLPVAPERQTLAQFAEVWLTKCAAPSVRQKTLQSYEHLIQMHILPTLGRIVLSKLSAPQVQALLNDKLAEGLSPRTVQYIHAVLRLCLKQALEWDLVPRNVATLVKPPKAVRKEVVPLNVEQAKRLLDYLKDDRLEALYSVALAVGLRQGEALGLRWEDVDLEGATLRVRRALQVLKGKTSFVEPKSARSRRTIALPSVTTEALRRHRKRQLEERLLVGPRWQEQGLVFTSTIGTPIHPRNLIRHYHNALKAAGLPSKRFHDLRHTCASLLLVQGVQPRVVMEILGHSQFSITMDTYSHVMPTLHQDAAGRMNALLGSGN